MNAEQSGTKRRAGGSDEKAGVSPFFSSSAQRDWQRGNSSPHNPPKGGCVGEEKHSPMPTPEDRALLAEMVREQLPVCAAVAAKFREISPDVRMVWASENGHVIGKKADGHGFKLSEIVTGPFTLVREKAK